MNDHARQVKDALSNPHDLCARLGLLDGRMGRDWHRQTGEGVTIRCPWHDEKTPSCSVTRGPDGTVRARCFGCGATGDTFTLLAAVYHLDVRADFRAVVEAGCDLAGLPRPDWSADEVPIVRPAPVRVPRPAERPDDGILDAVAGVLARRAPVTASREGMAYLRARGLDGGEALGWYVLPGDAMGREALRDAILAEIGSEDWRASGLATTEGPHAGDWSWVWRGPRLVIPWRAPDRAVQTLQGRYLGDCPKGAAKYAFPTERRPRWPYGCDAILHAPANATVALVEGAVDAASWNALARRHGVASLALGIPGVQGWRYSWLHFFRKRPCALALDLDAAGETKAREIALEVRTVARKTGGVPDVRRHRPRTGKDWNDVLRAEVAA